MRIKDRSYSILRLDRLIASAFALVLAFSLIRPLFAAASLPFTAAAISIGLSAACLWFIRSTKAGQPRFLRIGFHVGTFAFLLMYPLLFSDDVGTRVSDTTRWTIGMMLILTVAAFEGGYWLPRRASFSFQYRSRMFRGTPKLRRRLLLIVFVGTIAWIGYAVGLATFLGTDVVDVLAAMRAPIEGAERDLGDVWRYGGSAAVGMLFLAAAAASGLVAPGIQVSKGVRASSWFVLLGVAGAGFMSGSRAHFLYSLVPLAAAGWVRISQRQTLRSFRWLWAICLAGILGAAWLAMSALRGWDIRYYEGGWERLAPHQHIEGAFDIYAQLAVVVESFPEAINYQYGVSLVPLVLGWLPRFFWPDKPYPFSLFMNYLNGEDLATRSASIAAGLPGEGYGNFGLLGVVVWAILMGLMCRRADDWLLRFDFEHPLPLQLAAMCSVWAAVIVRGGVPEMFYMGLQVLMLPFLLVLSVSSMDSNPRAPERRAQSAQAPRR